MNLDISTMTFALGVLFILLAFLFYLLSLSIKGMKGIRGWGYSGLIMATGFFTLFMRSRFPFSKELILADNILLMAGTIGLYIGSRRFYNRKIPFKLLWGIFCTYMLLILYFLYIDDNINARIFLYSFVFALIQLLTSIVFFRSRKLPYRMASLFVGYSFLLASGVGISRAIYALVSQFDSIFDKGAFQSISFMSSLIIGLLWTVGFINLINQRLNKELQEASDELKQANTDKDKLYSIISHDLKGVISSIVGLTGLMNDKTVSFTDAERTDMTESVNKAAISMFLLLNNLLDWSRLRQGTMSFQPETRLAGDLLENPIASSKEILEQKKLTLTNEIPYNTRIFADTFMFQCIFRNLLVNAIKFTPSGGSVRLFLSTATSGEPVISITDTGIGMPAEMLQTLFQINPINNRKGTDNESSSGLGLLLCKEMVEKHGGQLWVESDVGNGSTFSFTLGKHGITANS